MNKVSENLKESHNVHVTPDECSRKKRRLDEKYRRNSPGLFTKHMAFLRGDSDKCPTFQAEPSLEEDVLAKVTFTKGAVMDTATIYSLIDVWDDMKDEYYKAHKDNQFYWKISAQMVLRGKKFSPSACQNKMNLLLSEYKAYNTALKRSGSGRPRHWEFYEALKPILQSMVSVDAELTYSAGVAVAQTTNPHIHAGSSTSSNVRWGKEDQLING
ncbi:uncharacterized protein LOC127749119 [Frankliniella occidentalis]|uniref:Uncharacterized protein LOC127749119 n=1 Tax=Frankliniella occidentalis TaxID=133901 RepID=A0A9C6U2M6_FRAOC|nr:uncharacterized protein LOC127749119 [Frankliniella occidentalis]